MSPTRVLTGTSALVSLAALLSTASLASGAGRADETADYTVIFDAVWSVETHPVDFPGGAHFSSLIGGTHHDGIAFWAVGELASPGIERMAESGIKTTLRNEVLAEIQQGNAGTVIEGFVSISSPGSTSTSFTASQAFPNATVVTMIAPSPDWFVGVNGTLLFRDGAWIDELVVELLPYDAGTDSGTTYTSNNQDTQPPEPITEITGYPFEVEGEVPPLGTFTFRRTDADECPEDLDGSGAVDFGDVLAILAAWGNAGGPEDLDESGTVDIGDVLAVLGAWGPCP